MSAALALVCLAAAASPQEPVEEPLETIVVDRDDVVIERTCLVEFTGLPIDDDEGDGVIHVVTDGVTLNCTRTALVGAAGVEPDQLRGVAIRVKAKNVTVRGAIVQGFKAGVWASNADGLVVEGCSFSDNFRQRLRSTAAAEDAGDWLWPHRNDDNEWLENYGAALYVEESRGVTLRSNTVRSGQNGICLRRVDGSAVFDNDASFLSGWGLAMHRSSGNVVDHNSFDFCVRGYSHGVYSRGQDSAGILVFEQCSDNVFAYNSATHSGDGFFGFAGLEALEGEGVDHKGLGCNRNLVYGNDFSYAPAIGIEMTFSFDNVFERNRLVGGNYGVWGGYSKRSAVLDNDIAENAISGVAIEHGSGWRIAGNRFRSNHRAVELWWDEDKELMAKPWTAANGGEARDIEVSSNEFVDERLALELRGGASAWFDGPDDASVQIDDASELVRESEPQAREWSSAERLGALRGSKPAVGARPLLVGRDKILITEWGPHDALSPCLRRALDDGVSHVYELLGVEVAMKVDAGPNVRLRLDNAAGRPRYTLSPRRSGVVTPYEFVVRLPSRELRAKGLFVASAWRIGVGAYQTDPREDAARWREQLERGAVWFEAPRLSLAFANGGPSELAGVPQQVRDAALPANRFGAVASTSIELGAGAWEIVTRSDDGVRVRVDGELVIDNWTHHAPQTDRARIEIAESRTVRIEVEYFELDGFAVLELELVQAAE